jgi:hypothetical protein
MGDLPRARPLHYSTEAQNIRAQSISSRTTSIHDGGGGGLYEHDNETSGFIKYWVILELLIDSMFLKDPQPWSY